MDSDHVLVLVLGLGLVGAAVALAYGSPLLLGGESDDVSGASLATFDTSDPYCGDPDRTSGSARTGDAPGGEAVVINETIPVASNDTTVSASLEEFGNQRYILAVTRETPTSANRTEANATRVEEPTNGSAENRTTTASAPTGTTANGSTDTPTDTATATATDGNCYLEVGINASIHVAQSDRYTVLVTYDGELVSAYWREGEDTGSFDKVPEAPEVTATTNGTATNGSEERQSKVRR